jgi:sialic acid synthase SpsE
MKTINVDGFNVGGKKTFIIADIGSNHQQNLSLAKESIDAAKESGANAVKFQSIQLNELYLNPDKQTKSFIKKLEFPEEWHMILSEYCKKKKIIFFSSPTYLKSINLLEQAKTPLYKIASAQVGTFPQLVDKVASLKKPTIFSTGIATYSDVINAVKIFQKYNNNQFIILHCNSIYPTPASMVNLGLMNVYKNMFGNPVGFSDHTIGTHISCTAVAMGAKVIEKHFTLDRKLKTPDSNDFASDPKELLQLVNQIREIELATSNFQERTKIQKEEQEFKTNITYRLVANKNLLKGKILKNEDFDYLRNLNGINCIEQINVIGKSVQKNIKKGELISYEHLS